MDKPSIYDIVLISVIDMLLKVLLDRNQSNNYRKSRLQSMYDLLHKVEPSYIGYIPDSFIGASEKFIKYIHNDLNSLLNKIKGV
jgi:hypothetical protein